MVAFEQWCIPNAEGPAVLACPKLALLVGGITIITMVISIIIVSYFRAKPSSLTGRVK